MKYLLLAAVMASATALVSPVLAQQGDGGYPDGAPGAATAAAQGGGVKHLRRHKLTNDTIGGTSSIDKSGMTQEGGGTVYGVGAQGSSQAMGAHAPGNTGGARTTP